MIMDALITQQKQTTGSLLLPDMPQRCEIELSSACNLRCTYCPRRFLDGISAFMEMDLFCRIIDELSPWPETIVVLHRRGESLLHPRFGDCLDYIRGKFHSIQIASNATLLDERMARKLIDTVTFISFSLDAPQAFDRTRVPARYADVEKKVMRFLDLNAGRVTTQVSMVRTPDTPPGDVDTFKSIWQGKVDRIRVYEEHSADGLFGSLGRGRQDRTPCAMPFYEMLVFSDGRVGRCNHDWNGAPLGDLTSASLRQVWSSAGYTDLRRQHATLQLNDTVCRGCDSWYPVAGHQMTGEAIASDA